MRSTTYPAIALAVLVVGHGAWLASHLRPAIWTPNAHGYFRQARLIADTGRPSFTLESPVQFVGPHWNEGPDGCYTCTHLPGFPLALAGAYLVGGPTAAVAVPVVLIALTLVGLFFVVRRWTGPWWGVWAAAMLAANPVLNDHALAGDSQAAVMFGVTLAVLLLAPWADTRARAWLLVGMIVPITLVYMSFYRPPDGQSMRFFLPAFPLYAMAGAAALAFWWRCCPRAATMAAVVCLAVTLAWGLPPSARMAAVHRDHNAVLAGVTDFLAKHVPRGSVVVAGVGVAQQLDFAGTWKVADATLVMPERPREGAHASPGGAPDDVDRKPAALTRRRLYGQEKAGDRHRAFANDALFWARGGEMYLLGKAADLRPWWNYLNRGDSLEFVAEYPLPNEPAQPDEMPPVPPRPPLPTGLTLAPEGTEDEPPRPPAAAPPANQIFDLHLDGRPLVLLRWARR